MQLSIDLWDVSTLTCSTSCERNVAIRTFATEPTRRVEAVRQLANLLRHLRLAESVPQRLLLRDSKTNECP